MGQEKVWAITKFGAHYPFVLGCWKKKSLFDRIELSSPHLQLSFLELILLSSDAKGFFGPLSKQL